MKERIKLIWDFKGPNAKQIAAHHIKHLEEFIALEKIKDATCHLVDASEMYTMAYMIVDKEYMNELRTKLKPHRGQLHTE